MWLKTLFFKGLCEKHPVNEGCSLPLPEWGLFKAMLFARLNSQLQQGCRKPLILMITGLVVISGSYGIVSPYKEVK